MKLLAVLISTFTLALVHADDVLQEFRQGNLEFSAALYRQLINNQTGNVIVSPVSVQIVLALTQLGANGETALELSKGLHLPSSPEKIKEAFKTLLPKLQSSEYYSLDSANRVYLKNGYSLNPDFLKLSEEIFQSGLENINFAENEKASQIINKWVESKTNDKIKNLISPDMLSELTTLVLVNAIYFQGNWSSPFDKHGTDKRKFFKSEKEEIEVDTMQQIETFKYAECKELDAKFLEIPYEGDDVTFTIALPNQKEGLAALETRLGEVLRPQNYSYERVSLHMPKFKIESTFDLIPALHELGIKLPFTGGADLSGILTNKDPLSISMVIQKAFINVTESGTEAAAATAVGVNRVSIDTSFLRSPIHFRVDRPFIYYIKTEDAVLFTGRITSP